MVSVSPVAGSGSATASFDTGPPISGPVGPMGSVVMAPASIFAVSTEGYHCDGTV